MVIALASTSGLAVSQETQSRIERQPIRVVTSETGMVVSETPLASWVGAQVLVGGGNAADAAVAVGFALAVTWPEAGNVAGGGFMMVAEPGVDEVVCVDYRETAPAAATSDMFKDNRGRFRHAQVGVPGTVAGLALAHERWGSMPWRDLLQPAITLAEGGFQVNEALAMSINEVVAKAANDADPGRFAELLRVYGKPGGGPWVAGDFLFLPDLARTLRLIAEQGPRAFYEGELADLIAADMADNGGLITRDDLAGYEAKVRPAIEARFFGHDVYGPPPPSAGGLTLAMMLHQLEAADITREERYAPRTLHFMAEAMRRAYHWRARTLGDADFVDVPHEIGSRVFGELLASTIDPDRATDSTELRPLIPLGREGTDTTHFSIVDEDGLAISNTYTLEMSWGSRMITPGTGLILNNEMGDFNPEPGVTLTTGQIGTPPNTLEPGKRMLSSQTPVIVRRDGEVVLLTGSPGGRTITNTVLNVLVSHLAFEMPLAEAVDQPRTHHQWLPDRLQFEAADEMEHAATVEQLRRMGHDVINRGRQGSANSIAVNPATGMMTGVPDWRRGAAAASPESPQPVGVR